MESRKIFIRRVASNDVVTFNNFNILKSAAESLGLEVVDTFSIKECLRYGKRDDIYIVTVVSDVVRLWSRGRKNICCWYQGIIPEESFMRNRSTLRFTVLSMYERFALNRCKLNLLVSDSMLKHYNTKYHRQYGKSSYIFPCFNTEVHEKAFMYPEKYVKNYFVYAGGLDVWQCFDHTLEVYKSIEALEIPGTKLIVMTKNQDYARDKIIEKGIQNYEVGFTTPDDLPNVLAKCKFGFVLREDTPVNRVSTPTKLSTYLSCGIIPIYSECVDGFNSLASKMEFVIPWKENGESEIHVKSMMERRIEASDVLSEFNTVFDSYYSNDYHIVNIASLLSKL